MKKIFFCCLIVFFSICGNAQTVFKVEEPNRKLSPYTGMTRQHWKDAALYLLKGAFSHVHGLNDPMQFPKQPGKSYPRTPEQVPVEKLEGLCRTMFIAGPLLKEVPSLQIGNIKVGDYYIQQIKLLLDGNSLSFIKNRGEKEGPNQVLVEFGGLALSLMLAPEVFWDPLPKETKDALAVKMLSYGEGTTIAMNWRFFNINILSFFKSRGYTVNEIYLKELLDKTLEHYKGYGWYKDGSYYDYYSMWAFQMYGAFWAEYFGKQYYPDYAKKFLGNLHDSAEHYPLMFGRDGKMNMWGRSISYRMGAAIPFPLLAYTNDPSINYGWMRRIASATILQFLEHPDFLKDNVPTLGFYGEFEPAVQSYSCRGSVYWMGKLFLGLYTPDDSPFWTATENEGAWKTKIKKAKVYNEQQEDTDILISNYANIGASEVRTTTSSKEIKVYHGTENYNRLSYNSCFPWQADGTSGEVAMNYLIKNSKDSQWVAGRMFKFKGYKDDVYYRDLQMAEDPTVQLKLAELTLPTGILRIDKNISANKAFFRLGHYALPELDKPIKVTKKTVDRHEVVIMDNGKYQLAMVNLQGWETMQPVSCTNLHPESKKSMVINATATGTNQQQPYLCTLMLWKPSGKAFSKKELMPVKKIMYEKDKVQLQFNDGHSKQIVF